MRVLAAATLLLCLGAFGLLRGRRPSPPDPSGFLAKSDTLLKRWLGGSAAAGRRVTILAYGDATDQALLDPVAPQPVTVAARLGSLLSGSANVLPADTAAFRAALDRRPDVLAIRLE